MRAVWACSAKGLGEARRAVWACSAKGRGEASAPLGFEPDLGAIISIINSHPNGTSGGATSGG